MIKLAAASLQETLMLKTKYLLCTVDTQNRNLGLQTGMLANFVVKLTCNAVNAEGEGGGGGRWGRRWGREKRGRGV